MPAESKKPAESLVQELLAERRNLMVANERLKLELQDARSAQAEMHQPAGKDLELEIAHLKGMLETTRGEVEALARERDELLEGIERALNRLQQK
jgi:hypothetical protein